MGGKARSIRNSAKAIIIKQNRLLVLQLEDSVGAWYMLPGGGQEPHETLAETLIRECSEEIGATIEVGPLMFIREYFSCNHEFAVQDNDTHQVEFMFISQLSEGQTPTQVPTPDKGQNGITWLDLHTLQNARLYPLAIREPITNIGRISSPVYMGDVN